jgi:hypothetical protein
MEQEPRVADEGPPSEVAREAMPSRRFDRIVLGSSALLAVAVPAALSFHVDARARDDLGPKLSALTGVASRIGGIAAGLTGTVRLSDVSIGTLLDARSIEGRVALSSLLAGQLTADEIRVEAPRLRARVAADGVLDLAAVVRRVADRRAGAGGTHATGAGVRRVRRIVVTGGELIVDAGDATIAARDVELHPQAGGVRVVTGRLRVATTTRTVGVHVDAAFDRAGADVALPGMRVDRMLAVGGTMAARGDGGPPLSASRVTLSLGDAALAVSAQIADDAVTRSVRAVVDRSAATITVDHVPLAAIAPWLPPAFDVAAARATGTLVVARAPAGWAVTADGALDGAVVRSDAIAEHPVPVDVAGRIAARGGDRGFEVAGALSRGRATITGTARRDGDRFDVALAIPTTSCLDLLDAIPPALRGASAGLTTEGDAGGRLSLAIAPDFAPEVGTDEDGEARSSRFAVDLDADVEIAGCKVLDEAPAGDPHVLDGRREHVYPDGSRDTVDPAGDDWLRLADLPPHVAGAFVAAEDARFHHHPGFDVEQIARSLEIDLREGRLARGGSTISQQLVKNVFLGHRRTFARKLDEAILTWRLEATTSKRTILEHYLNLIELGPGVFGVAAAARHWFGKAARTLTIREAAFLAALTPEPRSMSRRIAAAGELDPRSAERVDVVLRAMKRSRVIDPGAYERARATRLDLRSSTLHAEK